MSLIDVHPERPANPVDEIELIAVQNDWSFERADEDDRAEQDDPSARTRRRPAIGRRVGGPFRRGRIGSSRCRGRHRVRRRSRCRRFGRGRRAFLFVVAH